MTDRRSPESRYSYRHAGQADLAALVLIITGYLLGIIGVTFALTEDYQTAYWLLLVGIFTFASGRWVLGVTEDNDRHRRQQNGFLVTGRLPRQTTGD